MFNLNDYEIAARQEKSRDDTRVLAREASLAKLQSRLVVTRLTLAKRGGGGFSHRKVPPPPPPTPHRFTFRYCPFLS